MTTRIDPTTAAAGVLDLLCTERFDELAGLFSPELSAAASPDAVRIGWTTEVGRIGGIVAVGPAVTEPLDGELTLVKVPVTGGRGAIEVRFSVDAAGVLYGFRLAPPAESTWAAPGYAVARRFRERDVTLGSGDRAVPGTLTLPARRGRRPAVILVSSGAMDRDVSTGPNKPFKDLAWGLASRGIAVLRFDKVNFVHPELNSRDGFTMVEEYLPTALAAVELLQRESRIDPKRIFVLGHSGGGKAVPRIVAAEPSIAGMAILAGDTVPLPQSAVRVFEYLAAQDPHHDHTESLAAVTRAAELTASPALSPATPPADLLFGLPASYWLDLRTYDQVATAAALHKPTLILQGGRDYQVTAEADLPNWQAALADRPEVSIRLHPAADHMFYPGNAPSTPADLEKPNHVCPAVIDDLAHWFTTTGRRNPITRFRSRRRDQPTRSNSGPRAWRAQSSSEAAE